MLFKLHRDSQQDMKYGMHDHARLFGDEIRLAASLQGLDVTPARVMAQHLDVDEPDQEFFQEAFVQLRVLEPRLEGLYFLRHDAVLLRLALAFSYGPYE